jgi:hypothetical protein
LISVSTSAEEQEIEQLAEVMASLKSAYSRYVNQQRKPLNIPAKITDEYQALINSSATTTEDKTRFIYKAKQNLANFKATEDIANETNELYERYKMQLMRLGLKLEMPANIKAIGSTYMGMIESDDFTGADILDFEKRYQAALKDFTEGGFKVFDDFREFEGIIYVSGRNMGQLTDEQKKEFNAEADKLYAKYDEIDALIKQQKWLTAAEKILYGIGLGNELNSKIEIILAKQKQNKEQERRDLIERYRALESQIGEINIQLEKLTRKIEANVEEYNEPCTRDLVEYSCASRCPDLKERDPIFGHYKNVPNRQCLSRCNYLEEQEQIEADRETEYCLDDKRRLKRRTLAINDEKNDLIDKYNRLVNELRSIENKLR